MEEPSLQLVRDACADLARSEQETEDLAEEVHEAPTGEAKYKSFTHYLPKEDIGMFARHRRGDIPDNWQSKKEKQRKKRFAKAFLDEDEATYTDLGLMNDSVFTKRKVRVKICGHWIWNYASNVDMTRAGWLIFSIMTKCSLFKATELCRSWDGFFELSVLAIFNYFPSSFKTWAGDRFKQQLLMIGFMPYMLEANAEDMTIRQQTGSRGRMTRQHFMFEARPFICGEMRRHDPVTRRFIQYLSMMSSAVLVLARDSKDGKILLQPPEEQCWLKRVKSGVGRAAKNEFKILQAVGKEFFEEMDAKRTWSLSFDDHYDVYVWALEAGENFHVFCNVVQDTLWKAVSYAASD